LLKLLPFTLMWILFTFLYMFMPNTKVHFASGLFAGILIGTIFQIVQWAYITFQIGVVHYNTIYGSFAALPLFLAWLQISWLIVLFGVEVSLAYQTADDYEFEPEFHDASHRLRILLSLWVTGRLIKNFLRGEKPMTAGELTRQMEIPRPFVDEIIATLVTSKIISAVEINDNHNRGYQPAIDVNIMTLQYVMDALEKKGIDNIHDPHHPDFVTLSDSLEAFSRSIQRLPENKLLKEL
jgi:membrane protein